MKPPEDPREAAQAARDALRAAAGLLDSAVLQLAYARECAQNGAPKNVAAGIGDELQSVAGISRLCTSIRKEIRLPSKRTKKKARGR